MTDLRIFDPQQVRRIVEELERKISEKNQRINELGEENASARQFIAALFERLCGWGTSPTTADQDRDFINSLLTQIDTYQRGDLP
jgi:hypothetical protein